MSTENDAFSDEPVFSYSFTIRKPIWLQWWFLLLVTASGMALIYYYIKIREKRLAWETALQKEKIASQFETLKSQINPHFLFNSFNTLVTVIEEDPKTAVEYVEKLSDFYRTMMLYRDKEVISLSEGSGIGQKLCLPVETALWQQFPDRHPDQWRTYLYRAADLANVGGGMP